MNYYRYKSTSGPDIKAKADRMIEKLKKKQPNLQPVLIEGRTIAKHWWGKAWNINLESYADFSNRINRGKSYVKNHTVIDLKISHNTALALVMGSRAKPYEVLISIDQLSESKWQQISQLCNHRVNSLEQLLAGDFPKELEVLFYERQYGLFPSPKEIHFDCSCPDMATMCKHIAAVLYGIGHRFDENPLLFFELRGVDWNQLIKKSIDDRVNQMLKNAHKKSKRTIGDQDIHKLFGLE